ncbi:MAG: JAB domain-containing protein [Ruminococcus sp.]
MEKTHKIDVVSIRLVEEPPLYSSKELKNPCDVAELFRDFLKDCDREMFCILNLRTKGQVINLNVVGVGTLNSVLIHPREVFKSAILSNASNIILAHNHPSGNPEPSRQDMDMTKDWQKLGGFWGLKCWIM